MKKTLNIAIVQDGPVYLDLKATMAKAGQYIQSAADNQAGLIVFGETWLTGYPAWLDHCPNIARWDDPVTKKIFIQMMQNSITVPGSEVNKLCEWAVQYKMAIGIGINEIVNQGPGQGTIYNSFLLINESGELVVHHRKLMPTYTEKMLYGLGDGRGLESAELSFGRVGGLICWEHWMPLARQAMHDSGELIHIALWPKVHEMHQIASRHYAFEGRCFVVAVGQMMQASDFPAILTRPKSWTDNPDQWVLNGGSCVVGPDGFYLLEPQFDKTGILYCTIPDLDVAIGERMTLDVSGHYQRRDIF